MNLTKLSKLKRIFQSVFTKLFFISLAAWLLIILTVVAVFFASKHDSSSPFHKNISNYLNYIIDDLGSPPTRADALRILKKTGIHTSYTGKNATWTTRDIFPDISKIRFNPFHHSGSFQLGKNRDHHFLQQQTDFGTFYFEFAGLSDDDSRHQKYHLFLIVLLSVILLGCYFAIKKVLLPLKLINAGVLQVANGNLSHQVPVKGNDELADLAKSFNQMTHKLKELIETKEHLLRDVSHELRSPLTRMRVALELIDDQETKEDISLDIEQMETMIAAILNAARVRHDSFQLSKTPCSLNRILNSVISRYKNMIPAVIFTPPAETIHCPADENSLKTVLANLIDNGLKFSTADSPPLEVRLSVEGKRAIISVKDHGRGMQEEDLAYIFEPFYRVDKSRSHQTGGFGLGLSLCKAIMEAHGGEMKVKSTVGKGTEMVLSLPLEK